MADAHSMTLGGWIDFIIEYNDIYDRQNGKKDNVYEATQADFDNF